MEKSDINHSPAFREFAQKRCEEILANNKEYRELNRKILKLENRIKLNLTDDMENFLEYESLVMEQLTISNLIIFECKNGTAQLNYLRP
jgi:hypothetical protein